MTALLILLVPLVASGQPANELFQRYDRNGSIHDLFEDVYAANGGGFLLCGQSYYTPWVVKTDADGDVDWEYLTMGTRLFSVIETDNGNVVTVGTIDESMAGAICLSANGERVWQRVYDRGRFFTVIELKEGDLVMAGFARWGPAVIQRTTQQGDVVWRREYDPRMDERASIQTMRETEEGIVVAGAHWTSHVGYGWIMKVDYDGNTVWSRDYVIDDRQILFQSMVSNNDGGFSLAGLANGWIYTRINSRGDVTFQRRLNYNEYGWLEGIDKTADGGYIFAGERLGGQQMYPLAIRIDDEAEILWTEDMAELVEDQNQDQYFGFNEVLVLRDNSIVLSGRFHNAQNGTGDGLLVKLEPENLNPEFLYREPNDTLITVLPDTTIHFEIDARDPFGRDLTYAWFLDESELGDSIMTDIYFEPVGDYLVRCVVTAREEWSAEARWRVRVRELFIDDYSPDTLDLVVRRGTSVDFSIDTVCYTPGAEPEFFWTKTNLSNGEVEETGSDAGATIDFLWSGEYEVEGRVIRGESSDAVTWSVAVKGVIWAYAPLEDSLEAQLHDFVHFEVVPSALEDTSLEVAWLVDGDVVREGELAMEWAFSRADLNRPYWSQVQVVVVDSVEADTVEWVVMVNDLGVGDNEEVSNPGHVALLSVSPNPFNSTLRIRYATGGLETIATRLGIYDINGREVYSTITISHTSGKTTLHTKVGKDSQIILWDASAAPAGVYFVRLQVGKHVASKKVVLLR